MSIAISSTSPAATAWPATSPAHTTTHRSPATSLARAMASATPVVTKVNGASSALRVSLGTQSAGSSCVTTNTRSPTEGTPFQPLVMSKRCRPITRAPHESHQPWQYSAEACDTRNVHWPCPPSSSVSPFWYQSNSGPGLSSGRAMKPSRELTAWVTTLAMGSSEFSTVWFNKDGSEPFDLSTVRLTAAPPPSHPASGAPDVGAVGENAPMARRTPAPPEDFEENIVDIDVGDEMRASYLEYAYSVIYSRALPDA